jgi:hypothetical protein
MSDATKKPRKKRAPKTGRLEGLPRLMTHREVAEHFRVTAACIKRWVEKGDFPEPHSIIVQTWFYREDTIAHRLKTGEWPKGTEFKQFRI